MSRRSQLEHEVSVAQERIKKAAKDTPKDIIKLWEQDLVDLELELNNLEGKPEECFYCLSTVKILMYQFQHFFRFAFQVGT